MSSSPRKVVKNLDLSKITSPQIEQEIVNKQSELKPSDLITNRKIVDIESERKLCESTERHSNYEQQRFDAKSDRGHLYNSNNELSNLKSTGSIIKRRHQSLDSESEKNVEVPGWRQALDRQFKVQKDLNLYTRDIYN